MPQAPLSVCIRTFGCAKNEVDSYDMEVRLAQAGFVLTDQPQGADAIIVNTCAFIEAATEESIEGILDMAQLDSVESGASKIIVSGCMPARYGQSLSEELSEVSSFVPCSKEDDIVAILCDLFELVMPGKGDSAEISMGLSAYVKISDGCDRFCSYCTIPFIRGRYHSFSYEDIRLDVANKVESGAHEIVLIAQDTGRWGDDLGTDDTLASLMNRLADEFSCVWFRVMYIQPEGVSDDLLDVIATHDNICSYLDIPLQHVNERILRAMNRTGSRQEFEAMVEHIKSVIPDVVLRTTLIAGFPGETEEEFSQMIDFVEDCDFDYVGVFPYSQEEGTAAAKLEGQIDDDEKIERSQRIRDAADSVCMNKAAQRINSKATVLVIGCEEDGQLFGRTQAQAPDVDGVTYIDKGEPGQFVEVTIVDSLAYELEGEVL